MPEVRVLCSAGITRHQRSYDPVRFPSGPPPGNDVEAATFARNGPPPITRITFPTCRAHYPGGSNGCSCRFLPRSCCLPQMAGGSASALSLSRPAQASRVLRPAGSLSRPGRPLSRGFSPAGYPNQAARQLPDRSTIIRVESSSTGVPRLRGALPLPDIGGSSSKVAYRHWPRIGRSRGETCARTAHRFKNGTLDRAQSRSMPRPDIATQETS